jgi:pyruvate ferredoxin oxidoreductase gamma subunit
MALLEIRWHGRGGQGAKTAALLFADAAVETGKYIQAFPEYGPERMGAPVFAFNRISDQPIFQHCGIKSPNIVVVLDPTLMETVDVTEGLPEDGVVLVNTQKTAEEIKKQLKLTKQHVYVVDASKISQEILNRNLPNTPMLGALIKVSKLLDFNDMLESVKVRLKHKFPNRPEVVEGNIKAIKRAYEEAKA